MLTMTDTKNNVTLAFVCVHNGAIGAQATPSLYKLVQNGKDMGRTVDRPTALAMIAKAEDDGRAVIAGWL